MSGVVRSLAFLDAQENEKETENARDERHPEDRAAVVRPKEEKGGGEKRSHEGARRVKRLPKPEGGAPNRFRRNFGYERIARCAAKSLSDAVRDARAENDEHGARKSKHRFGEDAESVAKKYQELLVPEAVGYDARDDFGKKRNTFAETLDKSDSKGACAERFRHEERQQGMNHLGRDVHEKTHEPERPDGAGNGGGGRRGHAGR